MYTGFNWLREHDYLQSNKYDEINKYMLFILRQKCHNSKYVFFREKLLKVLKCY
jgi:hypothetical protein